MNVCTIVTRSFVPHARVLADTLSEHEPGARLSVLLVDDGGELDPAREGFEVLRPGELDLDAREFRRMAAIYGSDELCVALRPWLIRRLLDGGTPSAVWVDADVEVFAPLNGFGELTEQHGIVLTPHAHEPIPRDRRTPDEMDVLRAGPFSGGLIGVSAAARPFLDWWAEPMRRNCVIDRNLGLFREKSWLTFAPCYFEHHLLRDPTLDVVYWSLHRRQLRWTGERYEIDGRPLRSFHYTGFDPERSGRVSRYEGARPRIEPADYPDLARLLEGYADKLFAHGYREWADRPYGYARAANGMKLDHATRRLYRAALLEAERVDGEDLPDPFDPAGAEAFERWLGSADHAELPPDERASFLIERGPFVRAPTRFGPGGRLLRRLILRTLRHYNDHQREVGRALLAAIRAVDGKVDDRRKDPERGGS